MNLVFGFWNIAWTEDYSPIPNVFLRNPRIQPTNRQQTKTKICHRLGRNVLQQKPNYKPKRLCWIQPLFSKHGTNAKFLQYVQKFWSDHFDLVIFRFWEWHCRPKYRFYKIAFSARSTGQFRNWFLGRKFHSKNIKNYQITEPEFGCRTNFFERTARFRPFSF